MQMVIFEIDCRRSDASPANDACRSPARALTGQARSIGNLCDGRAAGTLDRGKAGVGIGNGAAPWGGSDPDQPRGERGDFNDETGTVAKRYGCRRTVPVPIQSGAKKGTARAHWAALEEAGLPRGFGGAAKWAMAAIDDSAMPAIGPKARPVRLCIQSASGSDGLRFPFTISDA